MTTIDTTTEKTIGQERTEFNLLHKLHDTQEYLKTAIRGLHTFLTIEGDVAILGLLGYHKATNIRVNLVSGKAKSGTYEQGKPFSMTDNRMNELEDAIVAYFKA